VNKSELVSKLTARLDGDRRAAVVAVNGVLEEIEQSLVRGEKVSLFGFGTFDRRERAARTARNPATGETVEVGASIAPVFRAGAGLKSLLAQATGTANGTVRAAGAAVASTAKVVPAVAAAATAPAKEASTKALTAAETARKLAKRAAAKADSTAPKTAKAAKSAPKSAPKSAKAAVGEKPKKSSGKAPKKK
jgi:DNA-binding protein HU-beta